MNQYFITFGVGSLLSNHVFVIKAHTEEEARASAFNQFGSTWAFIYANDEGVRITAKYGYTMIHASRTASPLEED